MLLLLLACASAPVAPRAERWAAHRATLQAQLGPAYDAPLPSADPALVARGAEIFDKSCAPCHGSGGRGDAPRAPTLNPRPADLIEGEGATFFSDAAQLHIIAEGMPGTAMPPWSRALTPEEQRAVYAVVQRLRGQGSTSDFLR